jgi:hypothetical protein
MLRTKGFHCRCAGKSTNSVHTLRGGALISILVMISCISHLTFRFSRLRFHRVLGTAVPECGAGAAMRSSTRWSITGIRGFADIVGT